MISASQDFITAVNGNPRNFKAKLYYNGSEVTCNIVSLTAKKGSQAGDQFTVGSVFSSSIEITCGNLTNNLENEDIEVKIGVLKSDSTYDYITYGKYTVIRAKKSGRFTVLTCVGFISSKFNVMLPAITTPTLANIAYAISTATGVSVSFSIATVTTVSLAVVPKDITCRGALAILAFAAGGYATEKNTGDVIIREFTSSSSYSLSTGRCLTPPIVSEDSFEMTGIKVIQNPQAYVITSDTSVQSGKEYYTRSGSGTDADPYVYTEVEEPTGNPSSQGWYEVVEISYSSGSPLRQTYQNEYVSQAVFNQLASVLVGLEFDPAEVDMSLGDPRLEPWDCITVTDSDNNTYTVPCHLIESTFDGGFSSRVWAIGEGVSDTAVAGALSDQIKQAISDLSVTQTAANQAKAAAASAKASAEEAKATTDEINRYADSVSKTVTQILADGETAGAYAQQAIQDAGEAKQSANQANIFANSALTNLGVVENVLDTLEWISKHGYYQLTEDESVVANKIYYSLTGTAIVDPTGNPSMKMYYERSGSGTEADPYTYALSADTEVGQKTYYSVTAVSIAEPTGDPSENGYYEMEINSALSQYVSSHLSLTDEGLTIMNDNSMGRMLLSTDGVTITNASGAVVGQYGEGAVVGDETKGHIEMKNGEIFFYSGAKTEMTPYDPSLDPFCVAYISNDELHIPRVVVVQSMQMGNWMWNAKLENHLSLVWIGG